MRVSLILPSYVVDKECESYLERFFYSLEAHTDPDDYQLVIIDNGSEYGGALMQQKADLYVRKDYPMGYARAVNCGISLADEDLLVVVNNDIEFRGPWLRELVEEYLEHGPGILAPVDFAADPVLIPDSNWYSLFITDRRTWQKVGYLDESLNFRFHDQDNAIKMKQAGFEVMRTGKVRVDHGNSITYSKMGRNEDPDEAAEMKRRYGCTLFSEWVKL